jgi:hypothetical protein
MIIKISTTSGITELAEMPTESEREEPHVSDVQEYETESNFSDLTREDLINAFGDTQVTSLLSESIQSQLESGSTVGEVMTND